jgi:hypothetical protein
VVDLVRWIPESITMSYSIDLGYLALVIFDVLIALTVIVAGLGMTRHRRWAQVPGLLGWGALAGSSALFGWVIFGKYHWDVVDLAIHEFPVVPRLVFYLGVLALMPSAVGVFLSSSRKYPATAGGVIGVLAMGLVAGAAIPIAILRL